MLKVDVLTSKQKFSVSFFDDDTILTVREQIAKTVDVHHDRLFILVACRYSRNYYRRDPRHWEALFYRLSLNGMPIERETFQAYISEYRQPNLAIPYTKLDKDEWMSYPEFLQDIFEPQGEFTEYRILGVETLKSYCLPSEFDSHLAARIPPAQSPIPDNSKLFMSLYDTKDVRGFFVKPYEAGAEGSYFPLFRATTPSRLSDDQVLKLERNSNHLQELLSLDPPTPTSIHILRSSWFVELVDSDFGSAASTRFEQIFYGLTVSKEVPCITYFTGRNDVSRHKFFTEDVKSKVPYLDMPMWTSWWTKSKPPRNRPTLVLYRGDDRDNYDRVSISSSDISFAIYRTNTNTKTIDELQHSLKTWFLTFDAIVPFIETSDVADCRWQLQDIRFESKYRDSLDELDTRRMNCVSAIFDESQKDKQVFRFLRSDYATDGITPVDLRIIDLLRDSPFLKASELEEELHVSAAEAVRLLQNITLRIEEDPGLMNRKFRGFPLLVVKSNTIEVSTVTDVDRPLKYVNILRYILSNPSSKALDKVCPKRVESVSAVISSISEDVTLDDSFGDLFGYLEGTDLAKEEPKQKDEGNVKIGKKGSLYNYFNKRLQEFDPQTFDPTGSEYPKKCEQGHQPVILSENELKEMIQEYNPRTNLPATKILETSDPDGVVTCPDYWCMNDRIPLQESQLSVLNGDKVCPVCNGKIRDLKDSKSDVREFSVIKRTKGFVYPGLMEYLSPKNKRNLPCCYKTARTRKIVKEDKDYKYYILGETKTGLNEFRFAYIQREILASLRIKEDYSLIVKSADRIQTGMSGFFRVGIGRPSAILPVLLRIDMRVLSPRDSIEWILKCSFLASWKETSDTHFTEINEKLKSFAPFKENRTSRESVARLISSIDEHYERGKLGILQEIEYVALMLRTDVFRINLETQTMGCTFFSNQVKSRTRGIVILQRGGEVDCLCHVVRVQKKMEYRANIFESPFKSDTVNEIVDLRREACKLSAPAFAQAVVVLTRLFPEHINDFAVVLDPFGRGQAIYVENLIIIPFQNTPLPPINNSKIQGYSDISGYPEYSKMKEYLLVAKDAYPGYEYSQDIHDSDNNVVEILTKSGLRIPVVPFKSIGENEEIIQTVSAEGEDALVFSSKNEEDLKIYKEISYSAEVYEFLLFQLTKDIHLEEYKGLQFAVRQVSPKKSEIEEYLKKWFNETVIFHSITEPIEFLSKIRTPCGQFKNKKTCDEGHMCGWNKNQCRIEVRNTLSPVRLFNKILATLVDNSKIRSMILDERTTPFFSTILYLELPNETILTDYQLKAERV